MVASRLKLWMHVVAGLACAAASLACVMAAWQEPEAVEQFRADAEIKDAGTLKQQEERDVKFRLINSANAPVEITDITTSCTCTRAEAATRKLQPGESTELTARLRVRDLRGRIGALVNVLYRIGDAQTLERLPLTITAMVEPHYAVTPEDVVFELRGEDRGDSIREASITIAPNSGPTLRVLKAYSTHPAIRVEKVSPDTSAGSTTIHLSFDPTRRIAPSARAEVIVHTDSKMEPIHRVPVRVVSKVVH